MMTAKLFENGRSQAVRLPKECQFAGDEVAVNKIGDIVVVLHDENIACHAVSPFAQACAFLL